MDLALGYLKIANFMGSKLNCRFNPTIQVIYISSNTNRALIQTKIETKMVKFTVWLVKFWECHIEGFRIKPTISYLPFGADSFLQYPQTPTPQATIGLFSSSMNTRKTIHRLNSRANCHPPTKLFSRARKEVPIRSKEIGHIDCKHLLKK